MRTCPSCGEVKEEDDFWSGARRCRKCVARETGALRSARAQSERASIKATYDLKISLSGRRFGRLQTQAHQHAETVVLETNRDRFPTASKWVGRSFVCVLVLMVLADLNRTVPIMFGIGCAAFATFRLADWLGQPRRSAVADVAAVVLREAINEFQNEQLEYLRF